MMDELDNRIVVVDEEGKEVALNILFTYENEQRNKKYVFVYEDDSPDDVMVFEYTDAGELLQVEDDEEYEEVEEVFNAYIEENEKEDA